MVRAVFAARPFRARVCGFSALRLRVFRPAFTPSGRRDSGAIAPASKRHRGQSVRARPAGQGFGAV